MDLLVGTFRTLRAHALRFGLTSLGIVWGAMMLTFLSATLEGVDRHFNRELHEIGPKVIIMWPGAVLKNRVGERGAREVEVDEDDVASLASLHIVEDVSPDVLLWAEIVRAEGRTKLLTVNGVNPETRVIRNFQPAEGRFISPLDVERGARVAFLGAEAATRLFGRESPIGRTLQIESVRFRVIGTAVAKGDQMIGVNGKDDLVVIIPYTTAMRWLDRKDHFDQLVFSPPTPEQSFEAVAETRSLMALRHRFSPEADTAISYLNFHEILVDIYNLQTGLRIFVLAAGVITLLVGAIGVMNIMLVVVGERTKEIGLRKAVGATSRAVFVQFLVESAAVCGLSGVLGATLGVIVTQLVGGLAPPGSAAASPPVLDPVTLVAIVSALSLTGLVAGLVPALRAARVPPAEALRSV